MKSTLRLASGLLLVVALLAGLTAIGVSAQGPTGTATATMAATETSTPFGGTGATTPSASPSATQTPAQAPAAPGANQDNPSAAQQLGAAMNSLAAGSATWLKFDYGIGDNTLPRPAVTIRLLNGVQNGLNFEVWSSDRIQSDLSDDKPVGRGTQEVIPGCTTTAPDGTTSRCTTNDLTWTGAFGAPGTYYIRIVNGNPYTINNGNASISPNTNNAVTPQLIVTGPGLALCQGPTTNQNQAQGTTNSQGTNNVLNTSPNPTLTNGILVMCQDLTPDQLKAINQQMMQPGSNNPNTTNPSAAPAATATTAAPAATATTASPTATETTAAPAATSMPTSMPSATPTP